MYAADLDDVAISGRMYTVEVKTPFAKGSNALLDEPASIELDILLPLLEPDGIDKPTRWQYNITYMNKTEFKSFREGFTTGKSGRNYADNYYEEEGIPVDTKTPLISRIDGTQLSSTDLL